MFWPLGQISVCPVYDYERPSQILYFLYLLYLLYFQSLAHSFLSTALSIPFLFLHFRTLFHSTEGGVHLPSQIEDNMNQQNTNSSFTSNSSALSAARSLSSLAQPGNKAGASAETPLPKAASRKSKSPAEANARKGATTNVAAGKNNDRCRHYTFTGRRCRLAALDPVSGLCFRHIGRQFQPSDEDLSFAFVGLLSGFDSPSRIHAFLTQVTVLLVQNRVSTRRAAVLTYLGQTLLRTLPAIDAELNPPDEQQRIIFDLPRPNRDDDISPERAMVNRIADRYTPVATPVEPDGYDGYTSNPDKPK